MDDNALFIAHPIIGLQVKKAVQNGATLIVANPKEIDLCRFASIFLQHRPGTDVALLMGMARVIVDEELFEASFIEVVGYTGTISFIAIR